MLRDVSYPVKSAGTAVRRRTQRRSRQTVAVAIQVHPVDAFQFEGHMSIEDFSDVFAYHADGVPGERVLTRANDPIRVQYLAPGCNPCLLPGAVSSFTRFTNEASPQTREPTSIRIHARGSEAMPR